MFLAELVRSEVVDNPTDGRTMYCIPVGVVDYRNSGDPGLKGSGNF